MSTIFIHLVDSSKRQNDAENLTLLKIKVLTLLGNVRFLASFRRLEESTH